MDVIELIFKNPKLLLTKILKRVLLFLPNTQYLKVIYKLQTGRNLHLDNPILFTEKLQWLKIHNRQPILTTLVDKHLVKNYVSNLIGSEYIIPTIGVWNSFDDIDFDLLPDRFVLKVTHDSGGLVICKNKHTLDKMKAKAKINKSLKRDYYLISKEWPYKNVQRKVIAEKYMEDVQDGISKELSDYKFYCFNGEPRFCQVIRDRSSNETIDFYDMEWNHMPFVGLNPECVNGKIPVDKPCELELMKNICRNLATKSPFTRVDLYYISGKVYFGEITFFPKSGFGSFNPIEWDKTMGDMLTLSF